jgi:DNA-binding beta-propeller fold protein YncE
VVEGLAGRGGMGVVYRARDPRIGRPVALKVLAPSLADDAAFRRRFEREWRLAAALDHPNVATVYGAGEQDGRLYLAMQFIDGIALDALLEERGRLPVREAAIIIDQVARALDAAHAAGLVHRDVKPANVLLSGSGPEWRAFLTDFGVTLESADADRLTRTGEFVGTAAYAAPEQLDGGRVDASADVYSLGALLHRCITGHTPSSARVRPARPSTLAQGISGSFERVVTRAMAHDPQRRWPSAGALGAAALAAADGVRPPRRRRVVATGAAAPARRPSRRWAYALAALAAAVAVVVAGVLLLPTSPPRRAVATTFRVGIAPERIAAVGDALWVMTVNRGIRVRVDTRRGTLRRLPAAVDLGGGQFPAMAAGTGVIWVAQGDREIGGVTAFDPRTGEALSRARIPGAMAIAAAGGAVWVTSMNGRGSGRLTRLGARTASVRAGPVPAGRDPAAVLSAAGSVWVADRKRDEILRFDPVTLRLRDRVRVGDGPALLAGDSRAVWVGNVGESTLMRIDGADVVGAPVELGKQLDDLLVGFGHLWVAGGDGSVTRLDAGTGQPAGAPVQIGGAPLALAASPAGVWVASAGNGTVRMLRAPR